MKVIIVICVFLLSSLSLAVSKPVDELSHFNFNCKNYKEIFPQATVCIPDDEGNHGVYWPKKIACVKDFGDLSNPKTLAKAIKYCQWPKCNNSSECVGTATCHQEYHRCVPNQGFCVVQDRGQLNGYYQAECR
jgi:hypothetical protein